MFWVGVLLIVSAGSFLYVSTLHIMPEVLHDRDSHGHGGEKGATRQQHYSKGIELGAMVVGLVAPMGLTMLAD
jgi:zinc transporter ZupT